MPSSPPRHRSGFLAPRTILGQRLRREKRFVVQLHRDLGEPQAVEMLCHEWAHALAWNFSRDRLSKTPGLDPVEFDRACHDEALGLFLVAGLAGVSGRHPRGGLTAAQASLGTVSKTVTKCALGARILRRSTHAIREEFA